MYRHIMLALSIAPFVSCWPLARFVPLSILARRISSLIDSTRIVASIVFGRANRGLLAEARCSGEAAASLATGTKRRSASSAEPRTRCGGRQKHLPPSADDRCGMAGSKDGIGVVGWSERV